eukprot:CAMPEP_0119295460 /NCGR_PEP_ID=MMETSP1329-20130426/49783_1 /TAXON_ID=114041 /ORGANISM="Genus nov. species nov., Strain RCC1024" /LENGTH=72 /DNA_ID=CAMNT_0007296373 /DNA_START=3 /DNA_END=217 /DNA_ORIENTATION=+
MSKTPPVKPARDDASELSFEERRLSSTPHVKKNVHFRPDEAASPSTLGDDLPAVIVTSPPRTPPRSPPPAES